jgi:dihydropteroate synthase
LRSRDSVLLYSKPILEYLNRAKYHREVTGPILNVNGVRRSINTTLVMGVINASPESFSDARRYTTFQSRIELASSLVESGADVIDIGGQSAITGSPEIEVAEEIARVAPVVEWVRATYPDVLVSVDTYKPEVVEVVLSVGAHIINDVSGLLYQSVAELCAQHGAALVIMHTAAPPKTRLQDPGLYRRIAEEVKDFLQEKANVAMAKGMAWESLIFDPGPDFAKTPFQTLELLRDIEGIRLLGRPLLLALSRKDLLGAITGRSPLARGAATDAAIAHFAATPGNFVRVHDVAAAVDVIATIEALTGKRDLEPGYLLPEEIRHEPPAAH